MSAIATFTRLPASAVKQLRFDYDATVEQRGQSAAEYVWSGYVLATLLPYLNERGIALMDSPLTPQLSQCRAATIFVFTPAHREVYFDSLSSSLFSPDELRDYFNEFNATDEPEIGQAMLDGIVAIRQSLSGSRCRFGRPIVHQMSLFQQPRRLARRFAHLCLATPL